jgi:N-terminal domain of reverse transcriptase
MQRAARVPLGDGLDWHGLERKHVYRTVKNLRQRILRASRAGDLTHVRSRQRLM